MGFYHWSVRSLSVFRESSGASPIFDIGDSVEVFAILKVASAGGTTPSLTVTGMHSIDGKKFSSVGGLGFTSASDATDENKMATDNVYRYLRFDYSLSGTSPHATFELVCFVKTRSTGSGGAPPTLSSD